MRLLPQPILGLYGVAIQIEDYASRLDRTPLSSVALQFIINVYRSSSNCTSPPRFSDLTRPDRSCIGLNSIKHTMKYFLRQLELRTRCEYHAFESLFIAHIFCSSL